MLKTTKFTAILSLLTLFAIGPKIAWAETRAEASGGGIRSFAAQLQASEMILIGVALLLFLVIIAMGNLVKRLAYDQAKKMRSGAQVVLVLFLTVWALMGFPVDLSAESTEAITSGTHPLANTTTTITMMILIGVIALEVVVIFILLRSIKMLMGGGLKSESAVAMAAKGSLWATLWAQMNKSVDVEKEEDILLDHQYDGIQELDNDLPPWWKWGFYITIVFAVIYLARYHVFKTAPLQIEEYEIAVARAEADLQLRRATSPDISIETVTYLDSESDLAAGQKIFATNCAVCHGQMGEGGIGPNLTDDYWIHGGSIRDIFRITQNGVIEKGMTPWRDILSPMQMAQVSSYIKTLRGTDPPNQKEPEGELYVPEESKPAEEEMEDDMPDVVVPLDMEE